MDRRSFSGWSGCREDWRVTGSFESGMAKSTFSVVPGSGTGKLASLRGHGEYAAADCDTPITLQYDIDGVEEDRESVLVAPAPIPTGP
jgi:hypothetical protein